SRKEQVLGELLADGGGAGDDAAAFLVARNRLLDHFPVEAFVVEEARSLGRDHGALQVYGNALIRRPLVPEVRVRVLRLQRLQVSLHERRGRPRMAPPVNDVAVEPELRDHESEDQAAQRIAEGLPNDEERAERASAPT